MVVDCDRQDFLGVLLTNDILVKLSLDLLRFRELALTNALAFLRRRPLIDDVDAQQDALVTDIDLGTSDQFPNVLMVFSAERATKLLMSLSSHFEPLEGDACTRN